MRTPNPPPAPAYQGLLAALDPFRDAAIRVHTAPDPDALGAGAGLSTLLQAHLGRPVPILFEGDLERVDTEALARMLDLPVGPCPPDRDPPQLVYVDCQPGSANVCLPGGTVVAVVDHHPWNGRFETPFCDLRPSLGSSATIATEYLRAAGVAVPPRVAAALLYGIRSDTRFLCSGATPADIDAFAWLHPRADRDPLGWIERNTVRLAELPLFEQAIRDLDVVGETAFVRLRNVERFTYVPHVADLLLSVAEIGFVAAWTEIDGRLRFSARSELPGLDVPDCLAKVLGPGGSVGGHATAGAGGIAVETLAGTLGVSNGDPDGVDRALVARFLRALGRES